MNEDLSEKMNAQHEAMKAVMAKRNKEIAEQMKV